MKQNNLRCSERVRRVGCEAIEGDHFKTLENKAFWRSLFATDHQKPTLTGCESSHLLTPSIVQEEDTASLEILSSHLSHLLTPDFDEIRYLYEERAAIYEYDAGWPQAEAEHLACQDTLVLMIEQNHLEFVKKFKENLLK